MLHFFKLLLLHDMTQHHHCCKAAVRSLLLLSAAKHALNNRPTLTPTQQPAQQLPAASLATPTALAVCAGVLQ